MVNVLDIEDPLISNQINNENKNKKNKCQYTYELINVLSLFFLIILNYLSDFHKHDNNPIILIKITLLCLSIMLYLLNFLIFTCTFRYETVFILTFIINTTLLVLTTILMVSDITEFINRNKIK